MWEVPELHESSDFLVVDKPPGLLTIPGRNREEVCLQHLLQERRSERLWVVHRLDRDVGGVLLFARNAAAHRAASMAFQERQVTKHYSAITRGGPAEGSFTFDAPLWRGKKRTAVRDHGKPARTLAQVVACEEERVLWRIQPETGRTHQIRVHLMHAGHVIEGDALYGSEQPGPLRLRAVALQGVPGLQPVHLPPYTL